MTDLSRLMAGMDIDSNNVITFDEFVIGVHNYCLTSTLSRTRTSNKMIHTEIDQFSEFFIGVYHYVADGVSTLARSLRTDISSVQSGTPGSETFEDSVKIEDGFGGSAREEVRHFTILQNL